MNRLVTAGPTFEPMDKVRRLTNFPTRRPGAKPASFLTAPHDVVELKTGN